MAATAPQPPARASEGGGGAPDQHGAGGAGTEVRRAIKALLFMAAVALPCLVLYRAVAPSAQLVVADGSILPWPLTGKEAPGNDVDLVSMPVAAFQIFSPLF